MTYYLLLTTNMTAQTMGQFLPATLQWGLPPFPPATQALEVMNQGSLVLDLSAKQDIVWRGVAQAKLKIGAEPKKREVAAPRSGARSPEEIPAALNVIHPCCPLMIRRQARHGPTSSEYCLARTREICTT